MKYSVMPRCCLFFVSPRRKEGAYLRRSATDEQRWRGEKPAQPGGRGRFALSGGVGRSLSRHRGTDMLVALALPSNPKRFRATWLRSSTGS
jgi:hypothetical protein